MKQVRWWGLAIALVIAISAGGILAGNSRALVGVDVHAEGAGASVALRADGPLEFESFVLDSPDRLVLDLHGVVCRVDGYRHAVGGTDVSRVRTAQHSLDPTPVTRVVFDLHHAADYRIEESDGGLIVTFGDGDGATLPAAVARKTVRPARAVPIEPVAEAPVERTEDAATLAQIVDDLQERVQTPPAETPAPARPLVETVAEPVADPAPIQATIEGSADPVIVRSTPSGRRTETLEATIEGRDEPVTVRAADSQADATSLQATIEGRPDPVVVEKVLPEVQAATIQQTIDAGENPDALNMDRIERLLQAPAFSAPAPEPAPQDAGRVAFDTQRIETDTVNYSGDRISLNLVDADIKQVFRLFHELSGINFVLDPGVSGRVTIVLDNVPWDQALDIILKNNGLDKSLENNVLRIATTQKLAQEAAQRKALKDAQELEVEPVTLTRTLSYARADDVERVIRDGGVLSQRGRVIVDERTNTLIISDVPKRVAPLDQLIGTLDTETPQVMIEARIVETSRNFSQDLGVVWGFQAAATDEFGTNTGLDFPHNAAARYSLNLPGAGGASSLGFSFSNIIDSLTLDVALNTLEDEGEGRILSSPKIVTQNNESAEIEQGVRIPIVNTTATEINVEFVSASLRLSVTPQITADSTIILEVEVENNSPDFVNTAGGIPSISTQRAQTKVLIGDGGTTVIGGIFVVNEGNSEIGVPWFRKIPVLGWLFKTTNVTVENRELLIFITPKIVKVG